MNHLYICVIINGYRSMELMNETKYLKFSIRILVTNNLKLNLKAEKL